MCCHRQACVVLCFVVAVMLGLSPTAWGDEPTDATGTWKWTVQRGGSNMEIILKLKQDGEKLTGTITGWNNQENEIQEGTIKDGQMSFKVVRRRDDQEITTKYTGKLEGDTIKGASETDIGGQTRTREFEAKRVTAASQPSE